MLSLVLLFVGFVASARAVTLGAVADTDSQSDNAQGTSAGLNISQYCTPYLKFDLSSVTGTVTNATLRVYFGGGMAATTITVSTTSNDTWVEGGAKPTPNTTIMTKTIGATPAGYIDFDLTAHVQSKLAGNKIVSVAMANTIGTWTGLNSRQAASNQPQLVVTTGATGGGTVTLTPTADRDTQSDNPAGTNAAVNYSQYNIFYAKFSLASVSGTVSSAKLRVYRNGPGNPATVSSVFLGNNDAWPESGPVPGYAGGALGSASVPAGGPDWVEIPVSTATVQGQANGDDLITLALTNNNGGWTQISSRQGANAPQLVVTTSGGTGTIPVTSITITPTNASIAVGSSTQMSANVQPANATNKTVTWQSSNASIASVNASGLVSGVAAGSASITARSNDGMNITSNAATIVVTSGGATVPRPSYNTGVGFYVVGNKVYDANGREFRIRGVNDIGFWRGGTDRVQQRQSMKAMKVNAVRIPFAKFAADAPGTTDTPAWRQSLVQAYINSQLVPIPGVWDTRSGATITCDNTPANITQAVTEWINDDGPWLRSLERYVILNIGNEWGPANSTVWRDTYIQQIQRLRAANIRCAIMVDAGGCGQDRQSIINYATAIQQGDPQHNVIFSVHVYGAYWAPSDLGPGAAAMAATGQPVVYGEFSSPELNTGMGWAPLQPTDVINAAEANGFGWLAWQWYNDSNENIVVGPNNSPQPYPPSSNLTAFGVVVRDKLTVAQPASIFP